MAGVDLRPGSGIGAPQEHRNDVQVCASGAEPSTGSAGEVDRDKEEENC